MTTFEGVRAITFDIDNTLWDLSAALDDALVEAHAELLNCTRAEVADSVDIARIALLREAVAEEMAHLRGVSSSWLEDVRHESFRRLAGELGADAPDDLAERMANAFFRRRFGAVTLFDGVRESLDSLVHRYRLGLVTNGNSSLVGTGLENHFSCHVAAGQHGWEKPDLRLFRVACARLQCDPSEIVHVGDSLPEDVAGAQLAGMRGVWFNPEAAVNDSGVRPDAEIHSFSQLIELFPFDAGELERSAAQA